MLLDNEIAITLTENELQMRRQHLRAVADELAERLQWLDQWLPDAAPSPLPPNDWLESLNVERAEIAAARVALLDRRIAQMRAEDAALLLWQLQLDALADDVRSRERAHRQPATPSRTALRRAVQAPQLSLDERQSPRTDTDDWRMTVEMPQAKLAKEPVNWLRSPTVTMTDAEHASADDVVLPRAAKQRTTRLTHLSRTTATDETGARGLHREQGDGAGDPRDLVPLATPHDLPTVAPAPELAPARHRGRSVTEPFVAALDLDGLYLSRDQVTLDAEKRSVHVRIQADAQNVERDDMPAEPQRITYRSREGDLQVFAVRESRAQCDGAFPELVLDVHHWPFDEVQAFRRALDSLP